MRARALLGASVIAKKDHPVHPEHPENANNPSHPLHPVLEDDVCHCFEDHEIGCPEWVCHEPFDPFCCPDCGVKCLVGHLRQHNNPKD